MDASVDSRSVECIFCAIVAGQAEVSLVYADDTVVAWTDLHPVTQGHLLVVPRKHAAGLEDLDEVTSAHVWSVGHRLARALRRSTLKPEGINVLLCDGEVALQTVFHFHLHIIPRYSREEWTSFAHETPARERALLDLDAQTIRRAIESTT